MSEENGAMHKFINAVREGDLKKLEELIDSYGLPDSPDWSKGYILLRFATESKHTEIVKLLLKNGSQVNNKRGESSTTPLHFAVKNNDIDIVKILVQNGADINANDSNGITPFYIAVQEEYLQIAEYLLKRGALVNFSPNSNLCEGFTPLHIATEKGSGELVELLLSSNANVDAKNKNGLTPLHIAIQYVRSEIVERLLIHGASIDTTYTSTEKKNYTLLHFAAQTGDEKIINSLLTRRLTVDARTEDGLTPLHIAIKYNNQVAIRLFAEHGADINAKTKYDRTPLNFAVSTGCSSLVESILNYGPDSSDESNRSALRCAIFGCGNEFRKIVESLLKYGFGIKSEDINDNSLLASAIRNGHEKIVKVFLKYGIDPNTSISIMWDKGSLLHIAASGGHRPVVELLINYGADVNAKNKDGFSPLYYAILNNNLETVELLLSNGSEYNFEPLCLAIRTRNVEIVKILLKYNADMNGRDNRGRTVLHLAVSVEDNEEILKLILNKGFDVDTSRRSGETALHSAVRDGRIAMVNILLDYDADVNYENKKGETALHIAVELGYVDIVKLLLEYGSDIDIMNYEDQTALDLAFDKDSSDDENIDSDSNNIMDIIEILLHHVVKLKCANLCVDDKHISNIRAIVMLYSTTIQCEEEIALMKSVNISNNVSYYDILVNNLRQLEIYMKNENIKAALSSDYYKINFPMYSKMLDHQLRKVRKRIDLLEQSSIFFYILPSSLPVLPSECTAEILSYLSEKDLKYMTIASEATNE